MPNGKAIADCYPVSVNPTVELLDEFHRMMHASFQKAISIATRQEYCSGGNGKGVSDSEYLMKFRLEEAVPLPLIL